MNNGGIETLLVPMQLEALVVMDDELEVVEMRPKFDLFGRRLVPLVGRSIRAAPWARPCKLKRGVHLHWVLPAALTHGIQLPGGTMEFPPVPNRWLVLRESAAETRRWILHSDYAGDWGTNYSLFLGADGKYVRRQIGLAYELDKGGKYVKRKIGHDYKPQETSPANLDKASTGDLTAVAPGNPVFAAYYPGCENIFGFHDELEDVSATDKTRFLYFVAGWYGQPKNDPMQSQDDKWKQHFKERWLDPSKIQFASRPQRTLCHGTLHSVGKGDGSPPVQFHVAVGNTAVETLSAFIGKRDQLPDGKMEPLLSAFQYDVLGNIDVLYGLPELDAELHRRRFYPVDGGTQWLLKPVERANAANPPKTDAVLPRFPEDSEAATFFDNLCVEQRNLDALQRERTSLGELYYAAWFQTQLDEPKKPDLDSIKSSIDTTDGSITKAQKEIVRCCKELEQKGARIPKAEVDKFCDELKKKRQLIPTASGDAKKTLAEYELVAAPMPAFWRASDPAILVAEPQDSAQPPYEVGLAELKCRLLNEVVQKLAVTLPIDRPPVPVEGKKLKAFPFLPGQDSSLPFAEVQAAMEALYYESLLLDPSRASEIRLKGCEGYNFSPALIDAVKIEEKKVPGVVKWSPEVKPLFMVWKLEWQPGYPEPEKWNQLKTWKFVFDTEYQWTGEEPSEQAQKRLYQGWAPLSLSLGDQLKKRLQGTQAADAYTNWSFLTQCANGITNMLILQEETLQLPPLRQDQTVDNSAILLTGTEFRWSPLALENPGFFPIRAGHIKINLLLLVDAFGRSLVVMDESKKPPVLVSESLAGERPTKRWIPLPPRVVQPSRLACSWVSVSDERQGRYRESNSNPASGPILGWIVPNYFDRSLVVCDRTGRVRCELRQAEGAGLISTNVPNGDLGPFELDEFIKGLTEAAVVRRLDDELEAQARGDVLERFLKIVDRISQWITTPTARQLRSINLVLGQPLVLARASLDLQVWGQMASNPPWAVCSGDTSGGLPKVKFPVRVGNVLRSNDGLIGYFTPQMPGDTGQADYSKMRLAYNAQRPQAPYADYFDFDHDAVEISPAAGPVKLTLLMDPRAGVHFASGILPAQFLELPEHVVSDALQNIELSFRVGPVLARHRSVRLPLPDDVPGSWSWFDLDYRKPGWQEHPHVDKPQAALAVPDEGLQIREGWLVMSKTAQSASIDKP